MPLSSVVRWTQFSEPPFLMSSPADLDLLRIQLLVTLPPAEAPKADAAFASLAADGNWPDIDYENQTRGNGWTPRLHLERTRALALQWLASGSADAALLNAALAALATWVQRDPLCPNWWHNQIGSPRVLGEILLVLGHHVPHAVLAAARSLMDRATDEGVWSSEGLRPIVWTGANRLWISANQLLTGAIYGDEALVQGALNSAMSELRVSPIGEEGIQVDGSFHQHGPLLFNGGYGRSYVKECSFFLAATHGTKWQPDERHHNILADFLLDGTRWMLRGADIDHGCIDREMTRPWISNREFAEPVKFLAGAGLPRATELSDLAEALKRATAPGTLAGNRMFYRADFMVQQRAESYVSVRMHSTRTLRAECCNNEGQRSHHVADGLTYLLKTGAEYREIMPAWDWQKLPGTTCLQTVRPENMDTVWSRGRSASTGGVSDGHFGACTQFLHNDHLSARKSWFFGPEGVVCLGAGIRSAFAGNVLTTLDQSLRQGPIEWGGVNGRRAEIAGGAEAVEARWLRHGPWAFIFPQPVRVTVDAGVKTGAWSLIGEGPETQVARDVFLAWLDHGEAPESGSYAYSVSNYADNEELDRAIEQPSWEIVENSSRAQALWRADAGLLQAMFFGAGEISWGGGWTLRVNGEAAVMATIEGAGSWTFHVADIRQDRADLLVSLVDPAGHLVKQETVTLPQGDHRGEAVCAG